MASSAAEEVEIDHETAEEQEDEQHGGLGRSYSMPTASRDNTDDSYSPTANLRPSKSEDLPTSTSTTRAVDRYGFLLSMKEQQDETLTTGRRSEHGHDDNIGGVGGMNGGATKKKKNRNRRRATEEQQQQQQGHPPSPHHAAYEYVMTKEEMAIMKRRTKKWNIMLDHWSSVGNKERLIKRRLRKGVPDELRGQVWKTLCNVPNKLQQQHPGLYQELVQAAVLDMNSRTTTTTTIITTTTTNNIGSSTGNNNAENQNHNNNHSHNNIIGGGVVLDHTRSFKQIQETIERDIHRTFPKHSMFSNSRDDDDDNDEHVNSNRPGAENSNDNGGGGTLTGAVGETTTTMPMTAVHEEDEPIVGEMMQELELSTDFIRNNDNDNNAVIYTANANGDTTSYNKILNGVNGQDRLRRVLKAYSAYDREIGYCQGMNFIAAMFLTLMSEEEAFWTLVSVMSDEPCRMRGLFGEGMRETHKVLYVAEKLVHQFLPRLARHMDNEGIHVTMYATQWLLTQYTSSFPFELVTRVWDCFLFEGWKITYRVMLSILQQAQATLLTMSFEEILSYFREFPQRPEIGGHVVEDSIKIPLRRRHIQKYEQQWRAQQPDQPDD